MSAAFTTVDIHPEVAQIQTSAHDEYVSRRSCPKKREAIKDYCGLPGFLHCDSEYGPLYKAQALPGEICAHKIVLSTLLIHLYQGAVEAYAAPQISASITSAANIDFTRFPLLKTDIITLIVS